MATLNPQPKDKKRPEPSEPSSPPKMKSKQRKILPEQKKLEELIANYSADEKWRQIIMFEENSFDTHFWLIPQSEWKDSDQEFFDGLMNKGIFFLTDNDAYEKFNQRLDDWEDFGEFSFFHVGKLQVNIVCQYFGSWSG